MDGYAFKIEYSDRGRITLQPREKCLVGLYKLANCSMIEVAGSGVINGVPVALVCDEEGLFVPNAIANLTACDVLAVAQNNAPLYMRGGGLVGTCALVADDTDLRGFTADEVAKITKALDKGGFPYETSAFTVGGIEVVMFR
jgi:hypothetical protein